ncbi:MAG: nuclear transport factor 2 family protein, partial [Acidobacteria bacterium]|nr:nuclear transport factor 2 family protein [Acidobacteriota bacterium]
ADAGDSLMDCLRRPNTRRDARAEAGLVVLLLGSPSPADAAARQSNAPSALSVAEALVDAFNGHDPEAMAKLVTADFELYYVDDEGVAVLSVRGPEQLVAEMTPYFASRPSVRSTIAAAIDGPVYVSFREQIVGGQSSLAVYEVRDGLIKRVWYFPAE